MVIVFTLGIALIHFSCIFDTRAHSYSTQRLILPTEIKSDIRRRMESAKHWMTTEDSSEEEDDSRHSSQQGKRSMPQDPPSQRKLSPRLASLPTQQATKKPSPSPKPSSSSSAVNKRNNAKKRKRVSSDNAPESLPFLANTSVSDIIVEEELRAKENAESHSPSSQIWEPEQVTNFFRGVYVHGMYKHVTHIM